MPTPLRCDPKLFDKDLSSQVIIVTGANSGCGLETSRQLALQKATVIMACRSQERGIAAAQEVSGVFVAPLDLASLQSVREFCQAVEAKYDRLDILINNAGVMACPLQRTKEGFEYQMGCNHLGHFLLMKLLTPLLVKTAKTTGKPSRFIALSSCAAAEMSMTPQDLAKAGHPDIDFDDINWESRPYNEAWAYWSSKLANHLHALEASKRYPEDQLISVSLHPGWVQSNLDVHVFKQYFGDGFFGKLVSNMIRKLYLFKGDMFTAVDGAQTTLHCALDDNIESGKFYSQFGLYKDPRDQAAGRPMDLPNPNATPEKAAQLWQISEKLVGAA